MEKKLMQLQIALNKATAEASVMNHLLIALVAQSPDKKRLLADFTGAAEETTVTAMNSPMPEEFVQTSQLVAEAWSRLIQDEIDREEAEQAGR